MTVCILHKIFKIILNISKKEKTDNPSVRIYGNKIENKITFKIKMGCYLEHLKDEISWKHQKKINENTNSEKGPHLEITEVVLVDRILLTTVINAIQEFCIHLFQTNHLVNC